jgi:hypothetical protein
VVVLLVPPSTSSRDGGQGVCARTSSGTTEAARVEDASRKSRRFMGLS